MAAGPRDTPHGRDTAADPDGSQESRRSHESHEHRGVPHPDLPADAPDGNGEAGGLEPLEPLESLEPLGFRGRPDSLGGPAGLNGLDGLGPDPLGGPGDLLGSDGDGEADPLDAGGPMPSIGDGASFRELRPPRRLRFWQLAPITALTVGGSLMFAFPLAFESGDAGPVVAMLGLLLCLCAAGWGLMAARRVGQTWPGLPSRGSGDRPDWRYVAGYTALIALLAVLAVWRVARLR